MIVFREARALILRVLAFFRLPKTRKALLLEAFRELLFARSLVYNQPFRTYASTLGDAHPNEFFDIVHQDEPVQLLSDVRWALQRINVLARGRFTCLMLAIAAKRMLSRRELANTLVLGVRPDQGSGEDPFGAHAWLRVGRYVVVGLEEREGHIPVASYHSKPRHGSHP